MRRLRRRLRTIFIALTILALLAFAFWWTRAWWALKFSVAAAWRTGAAWPWLDRNKGPLGGLYPIVAILGVIAVFVVNLLRHHREAEASRRETTPPLPRHPRRPLCPLWRRLQGTLARP